MDEQINGWGTGKRGSSGEQKAKWAEREIIKRDS